jgi:hypothetical protein
VMAERAEPYTEKRRPDPSDSAGAIYGTIAAMAVIAGGAKDVGVDRLLVVTAGTLCAFWLAHVYAEALSHHLRGARHLDLAAIRAAMVREWPLITGPVPMLVLLALGAFDVIDPGTSVRLALWIGVLQLFGWGVAYARRRDWGWSVAFTAGALNAAIGLLIVGLEVIIH